MRNILRDAQGKFAAYNWRQLERRMIISVMVVSGVVLGGGLLTNNYEFIEKWAAKADLTYTAEASEIVTVIRADKLEEMKQDILERLAHCESPGDTRESLPIIEDNNASRTLPRREVPSIGTYRFKVGTVIGYYKMQNEVELSPTDAVMLALDETKAKALASYIIFETPESDKGIDNWHKCNVKHGLEELVEFIKSHE